MAFRSSVKQVAAALGLEIDDALVAALALDAEHRLRTLGLDAARFMRHARRSTLLGGDVAHALKLRNVEALYGHSFGDAPPFHRAAAGGEELFFVEDRVVALEDVLAAPLPRAPPEPTFSVHWLAVAGVQPLVPQNPRPAAQGAQQGSGSRKPDAATVPMDLAAGGPSVSAAAAASGAARSQCVRHAESEGAPRPVQGAAALLHACHQ